MQADKSQSLALDDVAVTPPLARRDFRWAVGQREGSKLDACVPDRTDAPAHFGQRPFIVNLIANCVIELKHRTHPFLTATATSDNPFHGSKPSMRRQIQTVLSNSFSVTLLIRLRCSTLP